MSGSWNSGDRLTARINACKGEFRPQKYTVTIDDTHDRWRYEIAARAMWGQSLPHFLTWCAEYVLRHHRGLAEVRRTIREEEKAMRRRKREKERAEKARKPARRTPRKSRKP